jgi:hypothetical protein
VDRTSVLVVQATVIGGLGGAVLLERRLPGAALAGAKWPLFVAGLVLMCAWHRAPAMGGRHAWPLLHDRRPGAAEPKRVLLEGLGDPYRRFAAGRARLFPGVW